MPSTIFNFFSLLILLLISSTAASSDSRDNFDSPAQSLLRLPSQQHGQRCPALSHSLNYDPVIGILSHPGDGASGFLVNATNVSHIAASYVKFVESAGARVIPIIYNEPQEIIQKKLNMVNGVLFTGGFAKRGLYPQVVEHIFKKVLEKNVAGDHYPLFAAGLGFELLTTIIAQDTDILERFAALNQASKLQFLEGVSIEGTIFQSFPPRLLKRLTTHCLVTQNHRHGISPQRFKENSALSSFFEVLTISTDDNDAPYVSTIQGKDYPIVAFQWQPEKNAFEWGLSNVPHTEDAIQVTQHVANYFVSEARKSQNRASKPEVLKNLIYNHSPKFSGKAGRGYDEVYVFHHS